MSPWCWVLVQKWWIFLQQFKADNLTPWESRRKWRFGSNWFMRHCCLYFVGYLVHHLFPQHHRMQKSNADHVSNECSTQNKLPWPIRVYQRAKGQENHVILIWLELYILMWLFVVVFFSCVMEYSWNFLVGSTGTSLQWSTVLLSFNYFVFHPNCRMLHQP